MKRFARTLAAVMLALAWLWLGGFSGGRAAAAGPEDDLAAANVSVQRALTAAQAGDLATAAREYRAYEHTWFDIEDGIRATSKDTYRVIEKLMSDVDAALAQRPADGGGVLASLAALDREQQRFIKGLPPTEGAAPAAPARTGSPQPTVTTLLQQLRAARQALDRGDPATAAAEINAFQSSWVDVEGQIKTRSASAYRNTENDMARVATLIGQRSSDAAAVLDRMVSRLEPYEHAGRYGVFDATIILLREGIEALLVIVALLAFLTKSGNTEKSGWIWGGAGAGLLVSVVLGFGIHLLFRNFINGSNRELIEGITGLIAAAMLLYVSYWLHSQTSLGAWQGYIRARTTAALATGSLAGLGLLAFLAVFREGAETVLFFIGMAGAIATRDLLAGLAIGSAFLGALGVLLIVVGVRIPMRPFFAVASLLTFYLCFKFTGTGLHALQVADLLPAHGAGYLPESETLGLFPTWHTTLPQLALLGAGLAIVLRGRFRDRGVRSAASTAAMATD